MEKEILITGASTGIGAETARALAKGNRVFVHYNASKEGAENVAREVESAGGTAVTIQADLSSEKGCEQLFAEITKHADRLDILVNNAGGLVKRVPIPEIDWATMEYVFALNAFSLIKVSSLAVPLLKKSEDAVIVNVSSIVVRHGAAGATLYGASKGAVDVFTRGMAKELSPHIRVCAVAPGVIETPFHDKVSTPEQLENWRKSAPLQKNGTADDIAHTIVYIVENDFIHGETIDVNGGMFMR